MNCDWVRQSVFYHIYPLGLCAAPARNDFSSVPVNRLEKINTWIEHIQSLDANALYLGPVFESTSHGYDTVDYFKVDRRLGDNHSLTQLVQNLHQNGIRVVLDGVFNHVGRDFWAFQDVCKHHQVSPYWEWFQGLDCNHDSPYQDGFSYQGWNGHYDLVKLNHENPELRVYIFQVIERWINEFEIDGLRLDAADCIAVDFLQDFAAYCRRQNPEFWLMGEVVHGDYRHWANPTTLNSVTNYECYKGLYSSHVDENYFEIAYSLNRQFGDQGIYKDLTLYNFADNHDVNRVASQLYVDDHLATLYILLFCMPGVPSIYYGSEWGLRGVKANDSDTALRPSLELDTARLTASSLQLSHLITQLARIRRKSDTLMKGGYNQLLVKHQQLAFVRQTSEDCVMVIVNAANQPANLEISIPCKPGSQLVDLLNLGDVFYLDASNRWVGCVAPCWGRIMRWVR